MNLDSLITATVTSFASASAPQQSGNELSPTVWEDFLRPIFLKENPAEGAKQFAAVLASPAEPAHQQEITSKVREHLEDYPESVHQLQSLVEKNGYKLNSSGDFVKK